MSWDNPIFVRSAPMDDDSHGPRDSASALQIAADVFGSSTCDVPVPPLRKPNRTLDLRHQHSAMAHIDAAVELAGMVPSRTFPCNTLSPVAAY